MWSPDHRPELAGGDRPHDVQEFPPQPRSKLTDLARGFRKPEAFEPSFRRPGPEIVQCLDLFMDDLAVGRPIRRVHEIKGNSTTDQPNDMSVRISHRSFLTIVVVDTQRSLRPNLCCG